MIRKPPILAFLMMALAMASPAKSATDLTKLVRKIQPAVVTVVVYDIDHNISNIGTGFFINKSGHLITNFHVLTGKYTAEVRTSDGHTYQIKSVIADNPGADLVQVQVDIPPNEIWWINISDKLPAIAEQIVVVGSPMGLEQTVSEGIISSVREIPNVGDFFQMSAPISPGSSGSPVVNMKGEVLGVATFQFIKGQNLNFAVSGKSILQMRPHASAKTISQWTYDHSNNKHGIAEELCRKGYSFSINGENQKALEFFKEATAADPNDPMTWNGLGYCYAGLKNYDDAIAAYRQAIINNPGNAASHFNLGNFYNKIGRYEEAVKTYKEVIRISPDFEEAYFNLGVAYAHLGEYAEGKEAFEKVIRLNPRAAPAYYNVGIAYTQMGRYKEAIEAHKSVIRINPQFAPAHFSLGQAYGKIGRSEQEMGAYKNAVRIDPDFAPAHLGIGESYAQRGDKADALEQYKILKELDKEMADKLFDQIY